MTHFAVLDPSCDVRRSYFLEASAGTGKTYTIEHLVVRQLLEFDPPTSLDRILVVTFTRAATRELSQRIRAKIAAILEGETVPYLHELSPQARRKLNRALVTFDQAQIFTLHGFCAAMLERHLLLQTGDTELPLFDQQEQLRVIRDLFRSGLTPSRVSSGQLQRVLSLCRGDLDQLASKVLQEATRGLPIETGADFTTSYRTCSQAIKQLHEELSLDRDELQALLEAEAANHREVCDRSGQIKSGYRDQLSHLCSLIACGGLSEGDFDRLCARGHVLFDLMIPDKRKASAKQAISPEVALIQNRLQEAVAEGADPLAVLAHLAAMAKGALEEAQVAQARLSFDGQLAKMKDALADGAFVKAIAERYDSVIIDEFQDTDPIQWEIFSKLFVNRVPVTVVGDPKQSIYAFRNADVYGYLNALEDLGEESRRSLSTNFRSCPELITALNALFSHERVPGLFALPRSHATMAYNNVLAGRTENDPLGSEGAVHLCFVQTSPVSAQRRFPPEEVEEGELFPFIAQEIWSICQKLDVPFSYFAVLVKDRYQADRLQSALDRAGIPSRKSRGKALVESAWLLPVREWLDAVVHPEDSQRIRRVLGGLLVGWDEAQLIAFGRGEGGAVSELYAHIFNLHKRLLERGIAACFEHFLEGRWGGTLPTTVAERLLESVGEEAFGELQAVVDMLAEHQQRVQSHAEGLIAQIDRFLQGKEEAVIPPIEGRDAVTIQTTFASKGLEYGVVFALAMGMRQKENRTTLKVSEGRLSAKVSQAEETLFLKERDAEMVRLLYVALTRARSRVYLPVICDESQRPLHLGEASPVELLFGRMLNPQDPYALLPLSTDKVEPLLKELGEEHIVTRHLAPVPMPRVVSSTRKLPSAPSDKDIPRKNTRLESYTSLMRLSPSAVETHGLDGLSDAINRPTSEELPPGKATGILLHSVLESISFPLVKAMSEEVDLLPWISGQLRGTHLQGREQAVAKLCWRTLRLPLPCKDEEIPLCEIPLERCWSEAPFLFSMDRERISRSPELAALAHNPSFRSVWGDSEGMLTGAIDLLFAHRNRIYLVDWKSNWLGPALNDYSVANLQRAMDASNYHLQAAIYRSAVERYLSLSNPDGNLTFGGIFYLFLRGMGEVDGEITGVLPWV